MEPEEKPVKKKISIINILLTAVICCVAVLVLIFAVLGYDEIVTLDTTKAYTPAGLDDSAYAYAQAFTDTHVPADSAKVAEGVQLTANTEKALLFNVDRNEACFAQGIYDVAYPASLTKMMTAIVALKYGNLQDTVVIEESDLNLEPGSQIANLRAGDQLTLEQLFNAMVIYSANDASMAIARHVGGSVDNFVQLMNVEAIKLGMTATQFTNPSGLHESGTYTCAYDVYLMMNELIKYQAYTDAMTMNFYLLEITRADGSYVAYNLDSTDKYLTGEKPLPSGVTIIGGKTGTTDEAGSCLALAVQNTRGELFISIVMNAKNAGVLYSDMNQLLYLIN